MPKTEELPSMTGEGVAPVKIKALDNRIEKWREIVSKRMAFTEQEVESKQAVIDYLHENNIARYRFSDDNDEARILELSVKEKLKFKKESDASDEPDEE